MPSRRERRHARSREGQLSLSDIVRDIKALNASVLLISQKMQYIVRNEKILGNNLIILSKKIKETGSKGEKTNGAGFTELHEQIESTQTAIEQLAHELEQIKTQMIPREEFMKLKNIIDTIDPLQFTTIEQVKQMMKKKR